MKRALILSAVRTRAARLVAPIRPGPGVAALAVGGPGWSGSWWTWRSGTQCLVGVVGAGVVVDDLADVTKPWGM
jgi:hypothetical protein